MDDLIHDVSCVGKLLVMLLVCYGVPLSIPHMLNILLGWPPEEWRFYVGGVLCVIAQVLFSKYVQK
jgi:hypothetical protein